MMKSNKMIILIARYLPEELMQYQSCGILPTIADYQADIMHLVLAGYDGHTVR